MLGHRESDCWNQHGGLAGRQRFRVAADRVDDGVSRIPSVSASVGLVALIGARIGRATQLAILNNHELVRVDVAEEKQQGHPSVAAHERGVDIDPVCAQTLVVAAWVR